MLNKSHTELLYQDLQHPDSFRLLRLSRSPSEDKWDGMLVENRLPSDHATDAPKYVALSYVWGDPSLSFPATGNIEVGSSLSIALGHILLEKAGMNAFNIWIDQICINQSNAREREQQVGLKWRIYAGAEQVIGWLGPAFDGSDEALADLVLFAGPSGSAEEWEQVVQSRVRNLGIDGLMQHIEQVMIPGSDMRSRMLSLFKLPWFGRRWIAQEACLASNLRIYCGLQSVSGEQLFRAVSSLQQIICEVVSPGLQKPFRNAFALLHVRDAIQTSRPLSFVHLLQRLSFLQCKEDQDRINALFGILHSSASWFTPSYCPAPDLYVQFAVEHMRQTRSLEVLHFAGVTDPGMHKFENKGDQEIFTVASPATDLPSWVPDWRVGSRPRPILPPGSYDSDQRWDKPLFHMPEIQGNRKLTLIGKLLGTKIKPCGYPHLERLQHEENLLYHYKMDRWCNGMFVNFLDEFDPCLGKLYRVSDSFAQWHWSLVHAGRDPSNLLLRFARTLIMDGIGKSIEKPGCVVPGDKILEYFLEYTKLHLVVDPQSSIQACDDKGEDCESMTKAAVYGYLAEETCRDRTLFVGSNGVVGLGMPGISPGDQVCIFSGLKTPFVVHPKAGNFELRGECYVDGLMDTSFEGMDESEQVIVLE